MTLLESQKESIRQLCHLIELTKVLQFGCNVKPPFGVDQYYTIGKVYNDRG